jgi:hypothetical protein
MKVSIDYIPWIKEDDPIVDLQLRSMLRKVFPSMVATSNGELLDEITGVMNSVHQASGVT